MNSCCEVAELSLRMYRRFIESLIDMIAGGAVNCLDSFAWLRSLPIAATTEIAAPKVCAFAAETTEIRTVPINKGICGVVHARVVTALRLLFMFPGHSSQFIAQKAATQRAQSTSGPGIHAALWRVTRAVHWSSRIPIGIIAWTIGGRPAISRVTGTSIRVNSAIFIFRARFLLPWHSHRWVHHVPLSKGATKDKETYSNECKQQEPGEWIAQRSTEALKRVGDAISSTISQTGL